MAIKRETVVILGNHLEGHWRVLWKFLRRFATVMFGECCPTHWEYGKKSIKHKPRDRKGCCICEVILSPLGWSDISPPSDWSDAEACYIGWNEHVVWFMLWKHLTELSLSLRWKMSMVCAVVTSQIICWNHCRACCNCKMVLWMLSYIIYEYDSV